MMAPDFRADNPYQTLLADALGRIGVRTEFPRGYRRGLPLTRASGNAPPEVLHLHWATLYLRARQRAGRAAYAFKVVADLNLVRLRGVRLVWTVHNLADHEERTPAVDLWFYRRVARLADVLVVHDAAAREAVARVYRISRDKVVVIPHGHYGDAYGPLTDRRTARARLNLPAEGRVLLFFGMLRPYKGVLEAIRAWRLIANDHPHDHLIVAGSAEDAAYAAVLREAVIGVPRLRLDMRFVPASELPDYFGAADAVVLPFRRSLTSGSVALAATYGIPVVAPRLPSVTAIIGEKCPLLYDPAESEGLAGAMSGALTTPLEQALPAEPADWARIAALHVAAYRR